MYIHNQCEVTPNNKNGIMETFQRAHMGVDRPSRASVDAHEVCIYTSIVLPFFPLFPTSVKYFSKKKKKKEIAGAN